MGVGGKRAAVLAEEKLSQQPEPGTRLGSRLFSLGGEASSPNPRIYVAISKIRDGVFFSVLCLQKREKCPVNQERNDATAAI